MIHKIRSEYFSKELQPINLLMATQCVFSEVETTLKNVDKYQVSDINHALYLIFRFILARKSILSKKIGTKAHINTIFEVPLQT